MAGSTIGFDTSGVKIHPSLLQLYHRHQRGVNQGLRRGLHQESKVQVKNTLRLIDKSILTKKKSS
jgi:hypothetical protein